MRKALLSLPLWLLLATGIAQAQTCGQVVTHDLTFHHDLYCPDMPVALRVTAHGVRIDLNGHELRGTRGVGIVLDAPSVKVVNGAIRGFYAGIDGSSHYFRLQHVDVEGGQIGLRLNGSAKAMIIDNRFKVEGPAVMLLGTPGATVGGSHYLGGNRFVGGDTGIEICGFREVDNHVYGNLFHDQYSHGILIWNNSGKNIVRANEFDNVMNYAIALSASKDNQIIDNAIHTKRAAKDPDARMGISLVPGNLVSHCDHGPGDPGVGYNTIADNRIAGTFTAISLGLGGVNYLVYKNEIDRNQIRDALYGVGLRTDTNGNIGRGNTFESVGVPVVDAGWSNDVR